MERAKENEESQRVDESSETLLFIFFVNSEPNKSVYK